MMSCPPDDVSITATDATVAGSSVAVTEAYEDAEDYFDDDNVRQSASPAAGTDDDDAPPPPPSTLTIDPSSVDAASYPSSSARHLPRVSQPCGLHIGHNHVVDVIDPDILLDRMGFLDLDAEATQETVQEVLKMSHSTDLTHLSTINERMSEDAVDDVGALRDLTFVAKGAEGGASSSSSSTSGKGGKHGEGVATPKMMSILVEGEGNS
ncbi:hypothetical protein ACHAXA_006314 [Cyclostephanos tholiformis]|uniref:Uncharacterized protein n=1 Tax=Cyclostephanos tholiformis TaxID=382380 RepID=A0ABD3RD42_9STRA